MARWLHQCLAHRWPRPAGAQLLKRKRKSLGHSGCWWVATSTTQTMSMKRGHWSSCRQLSLHMMSSWEWCGANAGSPGLMMHSSPCSTSRSRLLHCGWNSFVACVLSGWWHSWLLTWHSWRHACCSICLSSAFVSQRSTWIKPVKGWPGATWRMVKKQRNKNKTKATIQKSDKTKHEGDEESDFLMLLTGIRRCRRR